MPINRESFLEFLKNPKAKQRVIELINLDTPIVDINKIMVAEGLFEGLGEKVDVRPLRKILEGYLKTESGITIDKLNEYRGGSRFTTAQLANQDRAILNYFLSKRDEFEGKPKSRLINSFNEAYKNDATVKLDNKLPSVNSLNRALTNATAGKYSELKEEFFGKQPADYFVSRHAKIFPEVKALDQVIKAGIKDGYILEDTQVSSKINRIKKELGQKIGVEVSDPRMENILVGRLRKLLVLYAGSKTGERVYEKELYDTIKPPIKNYLDSEILQKLKGIQMVAGQFSNADHAKTMGLPKKEVELLYKLQQGAHQIALTYGLDKDQRGKVKMAGDHTDIKSVMQNFPDYKKNFLRIAYISNNLNTFKSSYDGKINSLYKAAKAGTEFDPGVSRYAEPYSGALTAAEKKAGGRTIPNAIKKLQREFKDATGGYRLGGFNIDDKGKLSIKPIETRITDYDSPVAMNLRKTLGNLKYGTEGMKTIPTQMLNRVDQAIVGREGATTKGRINIIKNALPSELKGSGFMQALRTTGDGGTKQSSKITDLMNKGYKEVIRAGNLNEGNICSILGMKRGGLAGGGCGAEMKRALDEAPEETISKLANEGPGKFKNFANTFLNVAKKGGRFGAFAAVGAAGAGLVKQFRNDDPSTYLSSENQQKNMLIDMLEQPIVTPTETPSTALGDATLPAIGAVTAAGMIPGGAELYRQRTGAGNRKRPLGGDRLDAEGVKIPKKRVSPFRAATGPLSGVLGKGLAATGTPLGMLALEPLYIGQQIAEGDSLGEIATNPLNYLGPAFAGSLSKEATRFAGPKMANLMRLGISPTALKTVSRRFGLPGLALSAGISGYEMYQNKKAGRGLFDDG